MDAIRTVRTLKNAEILASVSCLVKNSNAFANRIGMRLFFVKVAYLDIVHLVKSLLVPMVNSVWQVNAGRRAWNRNVAECLQAHVKIKVLMTFHFLNVCVLF